MSPAATSHPEALAALDAAYDRLWRLVAAKREHRRVEASQADHEETASAATPAVKVEGRQS